MRKLILTPIYGQNSCVEHAAIAFSERQWEKVLKLRKRFPECWDPECAAVVPFGGVKLMHHGTCEYFMCVPVINAPYARIFTFGTYEIPDLIIDKEKEAVITALKENRSFRRLLNKYKSGKLIWAHASEFNEVRGWKFPNFYVIVNTSQEPVELSIWRE
jgi:hypothetical protein